MGSQLDMPRWSHSHFMASRVVPLSSPICDYWVTYVEHVNNHAVAKNIYYTNLIGLKIYN